ncbi:MULTISPECIES: ABC transporter ATP-binding protein [Pseudonocardia]|uniref:Glutathione import ATP-binding protein GsiA n=2 Tax=Pseudonocardia TaxID=1847 RepID=A0A1Y2N761_PSEAH|nr:MULTISPECIES: ATP-binding cassette domain-containing protein [Pseudonocardia]OSY43304.1 Glutathione import ATP-binding protein GsiA [Pseudonocardia autotrophica]TDN71792.1 peptide/nickel transport system ATP-binding protein [Pseudonocardia autotrophica]BBG02479.1 peptide ABC transporter ATP-binding protein [Pseudonocardia autotrophica]GEC26940.1 peptide ABC transporter ATP-binding protein [Pseudonocardia saturnea]
MSALSVRGLSVVYPGGHLALHDVDLEIPPGGRWAVVGRSGSGKTTLVRTILGLLPAGAVATGSVRVDGQEILGRPESQLRGLRGRAIGYVPQDPFAACDPLRTVGHHVDSAWRVHRMAPPSGRVVDDLGGVGIDDAARCAARHPHTWSGGMLQRATIVAGTAHSPPLTLADEPTSALDAELADEVLGLVRRCSGALLLVSHDLSLVARHAGHVLVLDGGRVAERGPAARLLSAPSAPATVELVGAGAPSARRPVREEPGGTVVVRGTDLVRSYGPVTAVDGVSVTVRAGEVLGVVGRSGSGKSTLARLLAGMERPDSGSVELPGAGPGHVMPVFQDPVASLDRRWPLWRTLTEPLRARGERPGRAAARAVAAEMLERVGLAGIDPDRRPATLSVGQAQRVAIARALAARPALLVADEPTASLDVATADAITALLRSLAGSGTAIVVVSHDRDRLAGYADRMLVMRDGRAEETHA